MMTDHLSRVESQNEYRKLGIASKTGQFVIIFGIFLAFAAVTLASDDDNSDKALYLTKYIENGDIETAQQLAAVHHSEMSIPSYAGYFTVNKTYNSNLFFWYFPAAKNADKAPVVLWLQGGPGESSMTGLFMENGPYSINKEIELVPREYSWHLNHHLIYIDNPVGAGYSFTDSEDGYAKNQVDIGQNLLNALQQFFVLFPHLQSNEFYVSGESYAGKYVPAVGHAIYEDSKRYQFNPRKPKINLKGLAIGNGFTDPIHQSNYADYLYQLGLIDFNAHEEFVKQQNKAIECMKARDFLCAYETIDKLLTAEGSPLTNLTGFNFYYNFLSANSESLLSKYYEMYYFFAKNETMRAIHVGDRSWHGLDNVVKVREHLKLDKFDSVADWVAELLSHYRILVYNGQLDIIVAYPLTVNYLRHLNFSAAEEYKTAKRIIWRVDNEIAGYAKQAGNLTEVLIRNAGHMASKDQPKWTLDMLQRFTHHIGFD